MACALPLTSFLFRFHRRPFRRFAAAAQKASANRSNIRMPPPMRYSGVHWVGTPHQLLRVESAVLMGHATKEAMPDSTFSPVCTRKLRTSAAMCTKELNRSKRNDNTMERSFLSLCGPHRGTVFPVSQSAADSTIL